MQSPYSGAPRRRGGVTLVELMVTMTIMGVLLSFSIPSFSRSVEQSQADIVGGNLRILWSAQRLYRLDNLAYAPSLDVLVSSGLLDSNFPTPSGTTSPYTYAIGGSDSQSFSATAQRANGPWTGGFVIDQTGTITGSLTKQGEKNPITPGFL